MVRGLEEVESAGVAMAGLVVGVGGPSIQVGVVVTSLPRTVRIAGDESESESTSPF